MVILMQFYGKPLEFLNLVVNYWLSFIFIKVMLITFLLAGVKVT